MSIVPLDIYSDPICPWCLIGKTRLERAIAAVGENPFDIRWRMFRLNPDMPPQGMDRRAYLEAKFGGPEGAARTYGMIAETARTDGLDLDLDAIPRTPQTLDAHRLIRWAAAERLEGAMVDRLFSAYFREARDIGDRETLLELAAEAGLDREVTARLLDGPAEIAELEAEETEAREAGVTGVPCFVIAGRHVVSGAQDSATWERIIAELLSEIERHRRKEAGA